MLLSFLEHGAELSSLTREEMFGIETQFTLYIVKVQNFNETVANCHKVLGSEIHGLHGVIRSRLSALISDADCNCKFKPAVLRLAAGDYSGFESLGLSPRRTRSIIATHPALFKQAVASVCHPISRIGPEHLHILEEKYMDKIKSHARNYVNRYARFLTMGDSTIDKEDIVNDLKLLALCAMRGYYPFRSGLHMENSMRRTITNRGRGYVTSATDESKRSVMQMPDGSSSRREVAWIGDNVNGAPILESISSDPPGSSVRMNVMCLATNGSVAERELAMFMLEHARQEKFISWLSRWVPECSDASDVADAVQMTGRPYPYLLARFLSLPVEQVESALRELRNVVT